MKLRNIIIPLLAMAANALAGNNVVLTWDASPDTTVSKYTVYEKVGASLTKLGTVTSPALTFTVPNISAGPHVYVVTAAIPLGLESVPSNEAAVPAAPGAPKNLRVLVEVTVTP